MAGNTNFDQILSTTLQNYAPKLVDNIFNRVPLFFWLNSKGRKKPASGGERLVEPLMYETNSTAAAYSGYETIDVTPQNGLTAAEYLWKQAATSISISGRQERQNAGSKEKIIDLLQSKVTQAERSLKTILDEQAFSTSRGASESEGLDGLQALVDVAPTTGSVGNINRATAGNEFWRNNSTTSVGSFASGGLDAMRTLYNTCSDQGQDFPDLGLTTQSVFEFYEKALQTQQRFSNTTAADGGFQNLTFKGMTLMWDSNCPSGYMYMLNSDYLKLRVHPAADFKTTPFIKPANQDAKVAQILYMGNLTMDQARRQGVLSGITA